MADLVYGPPDQNGLHRSQGGSVIRSSEIDIMDHCAEEVEGALILHNPGRTKSWRVDRASFEVERVHVSQNGHSNLGTGHRRTEETICRPIANSIDAAEVPEPPVETELPENPESAAFPVKPQPIQADGPLVSPPTAPKHTGRNFALLALGALGVVFGDIGTSPLYAIQTIFFDIPATPDNVIGAISTIFWLLNIVVTFKYVMLIMRADNRGEGGIMALTALASQSTDNRTRVWWKPITVMIGTLGASLFYGDCIITPAMSVLAALEGLLVTAPSLAGGIMPIALAILAALFILQRWGTGSVGRLFGPVMLIYFLTLAITGIQHISDDPAILQAFNPARAAAFLSEQRYSGTLLVALGGIVLSVTGAEALYADMGHFGRAPVRAAWLLVVLPCLTCSYLGQGGLLLQDMSLVSNPFFNLFPPWATIPAVVLATLATVIASQAVISGAFSVSSQAMKLGLLPRMNIHHMSSSKQGQIYIPAVNLVLLAAVLVVTAAFRTSSALASAYGMAVTVAMTIDGLLAAFIGARWCWCRRMYWLIVPGLALMSGFFIVDVLLIAACGRKFLSGAWVPLAIAIVVFALMSTWTRGAELLLSSIQGEVPPIQPFITWLAGEEMQRTRRTAVFLVSDIGTVPRSLLSNLKHNRVQHACTLIFKVDFRDVPRIPATSRVEEEVLAPGFWRVIARYGFKEHPDVPSVIASLPSRGLPVDLSAVSYFMSRSIVVPRSGSARLFTLSMQDMVMWRKHLFALMFRNATSAVAYFALPGDGVIELGVQAII